MFRPFACLLALSLGLSAPKAFSAEQAVPPNPSAPSNPLARAPEVAGTPANPPLTLEDAVARAMQKNFDLRIQAFTTENAREAVVIAKSDFDPVINGAIVRSLSQDASRVSTLEGNQSEGPRRDNTSARIGVTERFAATGGTVNVSTNISRAATNVTNQLLNPTFGNGVSATVVQPLLRGAGRTVATAAVERSKLGLNIANLNYTSRVLTVIRDTENAYYNLVSAREVLRIRQLSLELAQRLFEENQTRRSTGVATDLDVLTAEVGVANARRAGIQAEQTARDREDALLNLINAPDITERPGPVSFDDFREAPPSFADSYKRARDRYPDSLSSQETIKQLEIDLAVARQNIKPQVNLEAGLGYSARANDIGYFEAVQSLPAEHGNSWNVGLVYSIPWGQHADKARFRSALSNLNSQKTRLDQLEKNLVVQVRAAVRAVATNLASVEIAAQATQLSARQYELQKARFDAGLSTSRLVLQAQDDLEIARFNELSAKASLRTAVAELHRLEGSSIERFRVQLPQ